MRARAPSSPRGPTSGSAGRTACGGGSSRGPGSDRHLRAANGRGARARPPDRRCRYGSPGMSAWGSGTSCSVGPRLSTSRRASRSTSRISPGALARRRVDRALPLADLVLLRRERERVRERTLLRPRLTDQLEPPDRLGVLDELGRRHLDAVEERPPDGLALAVVVVEQLRRELLAGVEQLAARSAARSTFSSGTGFGSFGSGSGNGPNCRQRLRPALEQPVTEEKGRDAVLEVVRVDLVEQRLIARLHPLLEDRRSTSRRPSPRPAARSRGMPRAP